MEITIDVEYEIFIFKTTFHTLEPVLKDHPNWHKNVVSQDRWPLETGYIEL